MDQFTIESLENFFNYRGSNRSLHTYFGTLLASLCSLSQQAGDNAHEPILIYFNPAHESCPRGKSEKQCVQGANSQGGRDDFEYPEP
jgi:hypothetical protein